MKTFQGLPPDHAILQANGQITDGWWLFFDWVNRSLRSLMNAPLPAILAPTITTSNTTATAGATYTATEQGMLNALKSGLTAANADIVSLQATVNSLRAVLTAKGFTL